MSFEKEKESSLVEANSESSLEAFKRPFGRPPRKKQKILNEETYIIKLQEIIERDFFPNLENLRDKLEYLEACENHDILKLREIYAKYSDGKIPDLPLPQDSPATFDTPADHGRKLDSPRHFEKSTEDSCSEPPTKEEEPLDVNSQKTGEKETSMSLDEFMASHTSEDNQSFEQIMEERQRKFMAKHPWLFEAEESHNRLHAPNLEMLSLGDQQRMKMLALTATADQEKDIRPKNVENWTYKTFNSVMFVPDGAEISKEKQVELAKIKKREVVHSNTRYTENPFNEELSQAAMLEASAIQAYKKEGKVGVDGKELRETPKVNGYSYVKMPSPVPGVDESPLMTWGQVDGTPFQLDGSQTPLIKKNTPVGPSYKIPKVSNRDELLLKLTEKASQNYRDRKSKALSTVSSHLSSPSSPFLGKSSTTRLASMSPAARRLLTSKLSSQQNTDVALRASYTPSPGTYRVGMRTPKSSTPKTPSTPSSNLKSSLRSVPTPELTDNLLNLPRRQLAVQPSQRTPKGEKKAPTRALTVASSKDSSSGLTDGLLQLPNRHSTSPLVQNVSKRKTAADFF